MIKKAVISCIQFLRNRVKDFSEFWVFFVFYLRKKVLKGSGFFELNKDFLVKFFTMKRGRYSRPFLHIATIGVLIIGVLVTPYLASTYPVFSAQQSVSPEINSPSAKQSIVVGEDVFKTDVSQKPRDKVMDYVVQKGDTISTIAKKFGISEDTVRWENDLSNDFISVGDTLKILPVTGVAYKVQSGDSVYTIAKKFDTNAQQIVDFPFNDFSNPETFSLIAGQILIVPDGVKPSEQPTYIKRQVYIAQGPVAISSAGLTWPLRGGVSQFASWYHMAIDITDPVGTPIVAAENGTVVSVSIGGWDYGYGTNVWVKNGNGIGTHYSHMSGVNVSAGQQVEAGKTIVGWVGMTGRTTGPHLHFEVSVNDVLVNPLSYIQ
jgi:murein DD-endopeptidase MepM/ murein hydrolase activator NlpD